MIKNNLMKRVLSSVIVLMSLIGMFSCGAKRPSAEQVDTFMENLSLRMNMTKDNYMRFVNTLPEKNDMMSGTIVKTTHELISKEMKKERELINACKPFDADESAKAKSEALKQAAIGVIDTYIDGSEHELADVKTLITQGKTSHSPEVSDLLRAFETRLATNYEAYSKLQADLAKEFGITIY